MREWVYIKIIIMGLSVIFWPKLTVWIDSLNEWIDSDHKKKSGKGKNVMKNDTYQSSFETIHNAQDEDW